MKDFEIRSGLVRRGLGVGLLAMAVVVLGTALSATLLLADDAAPTRALRLSSVDGQVRLLLNKQVVADQAVPNMPLFEGTELVAGEDGRAEVQFEDGSVARLSPNSSLTLKVLRGQDGSGDAEIKFESGLGYFEFAGTGQAGSIRIKFGDNVVTASSPTVVRISLDNLPGALAVFSGNAHLERGSALALDLHGGESVTMSNADPGRYQLSESIEPDSWDAWNADRDQELSSEAAAHTGAENDFEDSGNPAWNDLDANGSWYNVPDQGTIWSPYDASSPDWDPYGNGYWLSTPLFGSTWVSSYGWGYLPYHCGTWNYYNSFGWGWAPGSGGCSPWWRNGRYGGPNIGTGFAGYHPPQPPRRNAYAGRSGGNGGVTTGLVAVNRRPTSGPAALPARDGSTPVVIAGQTVQALHPLSARPQYSDRVGSAFITHTASGYTITNQGPRTSTGPGYSGGSGISSETGHSTGSGYRGSRTTSSPEPRSTGSGGSQHSPAPVSHSSSGGEHSGGGYSGGGGSAGREGTHR